MWYICVCVLYVHSPRVHGRFYRLDLRKEMVVLENPRDTLDLSMMKNTATDLKARGKKPGSTRRCLVNSCQEKNAGVLFRLNYSIHQQTGIGCDTSS